MIIENLPHLIRAVSAHTSVSSGVMQSLTELSTTTASLAKVGQQASPAQLSALLASVDLAGYAETDTEARRIFSADTPEPDPED